MQAVARAQTALALRQSFEAAVAEAVPAEAALVTAFWRYARFERTQAGGAARAIIVLERAVARFPVTTCLLYTSPSPRD